MIKTKLIIASTLKPIDDSRMFEKFGVSLAKTNEYEVNIIGFRSKNTLAHHSIEFHPHGPFGRTSFERFTQPFKIFQNYIKVKPKVIICNTHELLIVTFLYKILFGGKIIYDIRENYVKNIKNTNVFHPVLKPLLAAYVRLKELMTKPFFDGFIMAEKVYSAQLSFVPKSKCIVIENKYVPILNDGDTPPLAQQHDKITLLYSGTLSESNGVFDAIEIASQLHQIDGRIRLKIIGFCALKKDLLRLKEAVLGKEYIALTGGDYLVPHSEIVNEIKSANFGLVLKKTNNGVNDDKLLTRLYEYSANRLPMIILNNLTWVSFCKEYNAAIAINPKEFNATALLDEMMNSKFYTTGDIKESLWSTEENKLTAFINHIRNS